MSTTIRHHMKEAIEEHYNNILGNYSKRLPSQVISYAIEELYKSSNVQEDEVRWTKQALKKACSKAIVYVLNSYIID